MKKQTRIGIIREVLAELGGNPNPHYFADGPSASTSRLQRKANESIYKIYKYDDGLTNATRKLAVTKLRQHPGVKDAYLSRKYRQDEGNLKIVFQN